MFGKMISELRKEKKMTLEEVGASIKKSKGYLSGIENAKVGPPTTKIIVSLAKALGGDAAQMLLVAYVEKAPKAMTGIKTFEDFKASVLGKVHLKIEAPIEVPKEVVKETHKEPEKV